MSKCEIQHPVSYWLRVEAISATLSGVPDRVEVLKTDEDVEDRLGYGKDGLARMLCGVRKSTPDYMLRSE